MMNSRRNFFKQLTGSTAMIATPLSLPALTRLGETLHWAGWQIRWNGWQRAIDQDVILGFWIARFPPQAGAPGTLERWAHWCTNGVGGLHNPGSVFDTTARPTLGFTLMTGEATDLERDRRQLKALRYLLAFVEDPRQDPAMLILPDA